jgi:hypothetical protein
MTERENEIPESRRQLQVTEKATRERLASLEGRELSYQATELFYPLDEYDDCEWYGKTIRIASIFCFGFLS